MPKSISDRARRREQHVGGLEVAVDHPGRVDDGKRGGEPLREGDQVGPAQRAAPPYALQEGVALDVLHHEVGAVAGQVGVDDPGHVGALDPAKRPDLAFEA